MTASAVLLSQVVKPLAEIFNDSIIRIFFQLTVYTETIPQIIQVHLKTCTSL